MNVNLIATLEYSQARENKMPLKSGASKKAFAYNVKKEIKAGKKASQAKAIAYSKRRESTKKGK